MKKIPLTQGKYALVDDEDYEYLSQWKWQYHPKGYATRRGSIKMHRIINQTPIGMVTDHINGDGLDNRKLNLRSCTQAQNTMNRRLGRNSKSGYKGVVWREKSKDFVVYINANGKRIWLKTYHALEDAVKAREEAEIKYHGEFARARG